MAFKLKQSLQGLGGVLVIFDHQDFQRTRVPHSGRGGHGALVGRLAFRRKRNLEFESRPKPEARTGCGNAASVQLRESLG